MINLTVQDAVEIFSLKKVTVQRIFRRCRLQAVGKRQNIRGRSAAIYAVPTELVWRLNQIKWKDREPVKLAEDIRRVLMGDPIDMEAVTSLIGKRIKFTSRRGEVKHGILEEATAICARVKTDTGMYYGMPVQMEIESDDNEDNQ